MLKTFQCVFLGISTTYDEESGNVLFSVNPYHSYDDFGERVKQSGILPCCGNIVHYPKGLSLSLTYDDKDMWIDKHLKVISCIERFDNKQQASDFISAILYQGKNKETAEQFVNKIGKNLFAVAESKTGLTQFLEAGCITPAKANELYSQLRGIVVRRRIIELLEKYQIPGKCSDKIFSDYNINSIRVLTKNPYLLRFFNIRFANYDRMGFDNGYGDIDDKRVDALIYESMNNVEKQGDTYIDFHNLCLKVNRMSRYSRKNAEEITAFQIAALLAKSSEHYKCRILYPDGDKQYAIYKTGVLNREMSSAFHIEEILKDAHGYTFTDTDIEEVEKELKITYAKEQKEAFNLLRSGVSVLTGGPGTGKTTTLNGMLMVCKKQYPYAEINLCAPTAAAAKRMKEATGIPALTVHKLLDINPTGFGGYTSKNENNRLSADLVVVDEASMLDLEIFSILTASIKKGASLLLLGDKDQLSSVGAGNVLHDLINYQKVPTVQLEKIFRQESVNSIVKNSFAIKYKEYDSMNFDSYSHIYFFENTEDIKQCVIQKMEELYDIQQQSTRLFTTARNKKYELSSDSLNPCLQDVFNGNKTNFLIHGCRKFAIGDPVIFTRNNYADGYLNGDTGIITDIEKTTGYHKRLVISSDNNTLLISGDSLNDVALAYASTVHKAQGSECDTAIVVVPWIPRPLLRNDLLYVAATRARRKNIFIVQGNQYQNAMREAIQSTAFAERSSGLLNWLEAKDET